MMRRARLTDAILERAEAMKAKGLFWSDIAAQIGTDKGTLSKAISRRRSGARQGATDRVQARIALIRAIAADGIYDFSSIGPALGVKQSSVISAFRAKGFRESELFEIAVAARLERLPGMTRTQVEEDLRVEARQRARLRRTFSALERRATPLLIAA